MVSGQESRIITPSFTPKASCSTQECRIYLRFLRSRYWFKNRAKWTEAYGYRLKIIFSVCRLVSPRCQNISAIPAVVHVTSNTEFFRLLHMVVDRFAAVPFTGKGFLHHLSYHNTQNRARLTGQSLKPSLRYVGDIWSDVILKNGQYNAFFNLHSTNLPMRVS